VAAQSFVSTRLSSLFSKARLASEHIISFLLLTCSR
jgi:hypothetical protein